MKTFLLAVTLFLANNLLQAQKTVYDPNAQLRTVPSFHAIKISDGIDLFISYGDEAVAVSGAEAKYRDKIKTEVEGGVLKISYDEQKLNWNTKRNLKAYVSFKVLDALVASGGCDVFVEGSIKNSSLHLHISGGSDFKGKVDVNELKIEQSGGSDINISGEANNVVINASGGSDFNGFNFIAQSCEIDASGGSDVEITVQKELTAKASGASDITYKGTPSVKESKASGASSVSRRS